MDHYIILMKNYPDVEEIGTVCPHPSVLNINCTLLSCKEKEAKEFFQGAVAQGSLWSDQTAA